MLANVGLLLVIAVGIATRISAVPGYVPDSGDEWGNTIAPFRALYQWGDPETFFHPSLYYYATAAGYWVTFSILRLAGAVDAESMTDLFLVDGRYFIFAARGVSVASAVLTLGAVYAFGSRLWSRHAGLIAAALLAVMPLHVHYSHTVRVDSFAVFFFVVGFFYVTAILLKPDTSTYGRAGGFTGLATAANYTGGILGFWIWLARFSTPTVSAGAGGSSLASYADPLRASAIAMGVFLLTSPFVLLNLEVFSRNFAFIAGMSVQEHTGWEGRDVLYYARELFALAPVLSALAAAASLLFVLFGNRRERFFVSLPIGFLTLFSLIPSKDPRFILPSVPLFCVAVGGVPSLLTRRLGRRALLRVPSVAIFYALLLVGGHQMSGRELAPGREYLLSPEKPLFAWVEDHVPRRSKIVIESGIAPLLDVLGEEGRFAAELRESLLRVRPNLDQEFIGVIYIGGNNYAPEKVASGEIDYALISRRNVQNVERRCADLPTVCEFYRQVREHGRQVYETPPGHESVLVYEIGGADHPPPRRGARRGY